MNPLQRRQNRQSVVRFQHELRGLVGDMRQAACLPSELRSVSDWAHSAFQGAKAAADEFARCPGSPDAQALQILEFDLHCLGTELVRFQELLDVSKLRPATLEVATRAESLLGVYGYLGSDHDILFEVMDVAIETLEGGKAKLAQTLESARLDEARFVLETCEELAGRVEGFTVGVAAIRALFDKICALASEHGAEAQAISPSVEDALDRTYRLAE